MAAVWKRVNVARIKFSLLKLVFSENGICLTTCSRSLRKWKTYYDASRASAAGIIKRREFPDLFRESGGAGVTSGAVIRWLLNTNYAEYEVKYTFYIKT